MNILITGASGFIGKNLLKVIADNSKYKHDKIILLTSKEVEGYTSIIHKNYTFTKEDFYKKGIEKIDVVLHFGAFIPKSSLEANDIESSISNINNTKYLLDNLPSIPNKFIFLSTIDVYGTVNETISEESPTIPTALYGQSKLFVEKMIFEWAKSNDVIFQILRIGHIYGEAEELYKKIIPLTIKKIIENDAPVIYSSGEEKRTFLNVKDCCNMILKSIELNKYEGPINIVGSNAISIKDLVNLIIEISEKNIIPIFENKQINTKDFVFNNCKMIKYLGRELISLKEGLKKEYEYFQNK